MKNVKKVALSLAFSFALLGPSQSLAATRLDLGINTGNVDFSEGTFSLNQNESLKKEVLAETRAIRSRLWDENILYTLNPDSNNKNERLQDVAKANGYPTKESYVNGLTWSSDLEKIAIQRAYEQTLTGLSHTRPDGTRNTTAVLTNGVYPGAEILASSTSTQGPAQAFSQWTFEPSSKRDGKSEYELLKDTRGVSDSYNGHLHIILDPELKRIGFSTLNTNAKWNYSVGIFDFETTSANAASSNIVGEFNIYAGDLAKAPKTQEKTGNPVKSNKLSEDSIKRLRESVERARKSIAGAKILMDTMPKFAKENGTKLNGIIANSEKVIDQAEKILADY